MFVIKQVSKVTTMSMKSAYISLSNYNVAVIDCTFHSRIYIKLWSWFYIHVILINFFQFFTTSTILQVCPKWIYYSYFYYSVYSIIIKPSLSSWILLLNSLMSSHYDDIMVLNWIMIRGCNIYHMFSSLHPSSLYYPLPSFRFISHPFY